MIHQHGQLRNLVIRHQFVESENSPKPTPMPIGLADFVANLHSQPRIALRGTARGTSQIVDSLEKLSYYLIVRVPE